MAGRESRERTSSKGSAAEPNSMMGLTKNGREVVLQNENNSMMDEVENVGRYVEFSTRKNIASLESRCYTRKL